IFVIASAPAIEPATLTLPVKMKLSTKVSILPVILQLTALRMERKWESRTRMNIGPPRFPPALDHVGYPRKGRGNSSNSMQLTLLGGGGGRSLIRTILLERLGDHDRALFGGVFFAAFSWCRFQVRL